MATLIQLRRGTREQWFEHNPVLALGEPGFETDTKILRIGDGVTAFANLTEALNIQACDILLNKAIDQITTLSSSAASLIDNKLQAALLKIENQTTNKAVFSVNSGRTDSDGNPNFVLQSLTKIKAIAPFTYTTASGISHTTDEDLWFDSSALANGDYNLFVNYDGNYKLIVLSNTIYRQNDLPVEATENDIWLNTSTYPQISYIFTKTHWIQTDYVPIGNLTQSDDLPGDEIFDALPEPQNPITPETTYFDLKITNYPGLDQTYYDSIVVNMNVEAIDGSVSALTHTFTKGNERLSFKEGDKVSITSISNYAAINYDSYEKAEINSNVSIGSNEIENSGSVGTILSLTDDIVINNIDLTHGPVNIPFNLSAALAREDIIKFDDGSLISISENGTIDYKTPGTNGEYITLQESFNPGLKYYLVVGLIDDIFSFNIFNSPQSALGTGISTSIVHSKITILNNNKMKNINLTNATYIDDTDTEIHLAQKVIEKTENNYNPANSSIVLYTNSSGSQLYEYGTLIEQYKILYANFIPNPPEEDYVEEDEPTII